VTTLDFSPESVPRQIPPTSAGSFPGSSEFLLGTGNNVTEALCLLNGAELVVAAHQH
jgi:hypothetical protein